MRAILGPHSLQSRHMILRRPPLPLTTEPRLGAVLVENALVISVFAVFLAGILEFGHAYMVINSLNAAATRAARYGATEGVTTTQVKTMANNILNKAFKSNKATVVVKNAGVFDTTTVNPKTINYGALPDAEVSTMTSRQLYIVRITVPYNNVSLLPPFWVKNVTLHGQSVMRHE